MLAWCKRLCVYSLSLLVKDFDPFSVGTRLLLRYGPPWKAPSLALILPKLVFVNPGSLLLVVAEQVVIQCERFRILADIAVLQPS